MTTLIRKRSEMKRVPLERCHGGEGALDWTTGLDGKDLPGRRLRFVHDDVLAPGVSIGFHEHAEDEEYYYVVTSSGTMQLDERQFDVSAGDIAAVYPGGRHALANNSVEDLRIIVFSVSADTRARD